MAGNSNSGRRPKVFNARVARDKLSKMTPRAMRNIRQSIDDGNVENSKWLLTFLMPRQLTPEDTAGMLTTLADVTKLALKHTTEPGDCISNGGPLPMQEHDEVVRKALERDHKRDSVEYDHDNYRHIEDNRMAIESSLMYGQEDNRMGVKNVKGTVPEWVHKSAYKGSSLQQHHGEVLGDT